MGVLVIENFVVNVNSSSNAIFGFEIQFLDEGSDKKHVFTTRTEESMKQWVKLLRLARFVLSKLVSVISEKYFHLKRFYA